MADDPRSEIRTSELLKKLQDYVLGRAEMDAAQVKVAEMLLKKSLPDLPSGKASAGDGASPMAGYEIKPLSPEEARLLRDQLHKTY